MWPRPVEAVIFDMDGLLFDTERVLFEVMVQVAPDFGVEADLATFKQMIGLPMVASNARLLERYGETFPVTDYIKAVGARWREAHSAGVILKAGVVELLDHLDARNLPRAIATSSPHASVERHLGQHGLTHRFGAVIARGDYENGKPAPDPFLKAAAALGVDPALCLALEDSHNGVRAAHAAGMMTVMVPDMLDPTEEMQELCLHIADSLHHVRDLLTASRRG